MNPGEPDPGLERVKFQLRADGVHGESPNPLRSGVHSRGYLPHESRERAVMQITRRLEMEQRVAWLEADGGAAAANVAQTVCLLCRRLAVGRAQLLER